MEVKIYLACPKWQVELLNVVLLNIYPNFINLIPKKVKLLQTSSGILDEREMFKTFRRKEIMLTVNLSGMSENFGASSASILT